MIVISGGRPVPSKSPPRIASTVLAKFSARIRKKAHQRKKGQFFIADLLGKMGKNVAGGDDGKRHDGQRRIDAGRQGKDAGVGDIKPRHFVRFMAA